MTIPRDTHKADRIGMVRVARTLSNVISPPIMFAITGLALGFYERPVWPGLAWAQPLSDPSRTLTVIPPAGWQSASQDKLLLLASPDQTASMALGARGSIPLADPAAMKAVVAELTGTDWKLAGNSRTTVGGVPAVRIDKSRACISLI